VVAAFVLLLMTAPVISGGVAFLSFSVIPFGPAVSAFGHWTLPQVADVPVAVLGAGHLVDRGVRAGAGGLGVELDVAAAGRHARGGADDLVRGRDGDCRWWRCS
jgi:hypothetical protein